MEGRGDSCRVLSLLACSCQAPNQNPSQHPCRACKLLEASSGGGGGGVAAGEWELEGYLQGKVHGLESDGWG